MPSRPGPPHVVAPLAVRIRLSVPPVVLDAEFRGVSPLRNRTLPDSTTPYRNRHSAPNACFIGERRAEVLDWDGGQGRNRTTDTRIFSPLLYQLSYLAGCGSRARTSGGGVLNRPRAGGSSKQRRATRASRPPAPVGPSWPCASLRVLRGDCRAPDTHRRRRAVRVDRRFDRRGWPVSVRGRP